MNYNDWYALNQTNQTNENPSFTHELWWFREQVVEGEKTCRDRRKLTVVLKSANFSLNQMKDDVVHSIGFQTFFVQAFKIVVDSWEFSMLLLYILRDDWPIFIISGSNQQLQ